MRSLQRDEPSIAEQAALWMGRLQRDDDRERAAFASWLRASPQHVREFLLQSALDKEVAALDLASFDVDEVLARAHGNVFRLPSEGQTDERRSMERRGWRWGVGLAATVLLAAAAGWMTIGSGSSQTYATLVGEQRAFELADGSVVELNPVSKISVRMSSEARDIRLLAGEALFKVERDPTRPFRVRSGDTVVRAVGTKFVILRRAGSVTVSVIEGRVAVSDAKAPLSLTAAPGPEEAKGQEHTLDAGEKVKIVKGAKAIEHSTTDATQMNGWRGRQLTFSGDTLADIAEDFNRYNRAPQIQIEGDALRNRQFSGVFDADDPRSLIDYLAHMEELSIERSAAIIVIRTADRSP